MVNMVLHMFMYQTRRHQQTEKPVSKIRNVQSVMEDILCSCPVVQKTLLDYRSTDC